VKGGQMILRKYLLHVGLFVVMIIIWGHSAVSVAIDAHKVARLSVDQVNAMLANPETVIIDVRKYRNWWRSSKKISTAVREDPQNVDHWIGKYTQDKTLIFYCD
jgi:hypothetical protein